QYDSLTKLSNRMFFREGLRRAMARAVRNRNMLAVLFIDLDHFKRINDTLGHPAGDQLLQEAANRLEHAVRETDIIGLQRPETDYRLARQGGDEFTILLSELNDPLVASGVAQRILEHMTQAITLGDNEVVVTASIGISVFPDDGDEVDTLLKNADVAMYSAKASGRNQYRFFEAAMQANAVRRLALENDMRQGIARNQFVLYYQPQVDAISGTLQSFEALMRWNHPERGLIAPSDFIPVAEETGLILPLTQLALEQVCRDIPDWKARFGLDIRVAINISGRVIELTDLARLIGEALAQSGINPELIEAELTESVLMEGGERTRQLLEELQTLGVRISIDDFGTGYSSLAYLKALPIDVLKIDKSFVNDVCSDPSSATIARTIIAMAHNLSLRVVAEGVETAAQRDFLRDEQCETLQGYLFSRPLPQERVLELLAAKAASETT
ncbi:MAG TPA: EAL domain-containing protein, partial [Azonexus sp.]|nr:EAL domain-containing protein [Azonexus sp.]